MMELMDDRFVLNAAWVVGTAFLYVFLSIEVAVTWCSVGCVHKTKKESFCCTPQRPHTHIYIYQGLLSHHLLYR
jgi:hypothetical protein